MTVRSCTGSIRSRSRSTETNAASVTAASAVGAAVAAGIDAAAEVLTATDANEMAALLGFELNDTGVTDS